MAMHWEDERYVRLYTRDTTTWKLLPWQAKCLLPLILRKLDRRGEADVGEPAEEGVAALTDLPLELVREGLPALLARKVLELEGALLRMPNYRAAQEAKASDRARQAAKRERDRAAAQGVTQRDDMSHSVTDRHEESRDVTAVHAGSRDVTPSLAEPSLAEPSQGAARAPARSTAPAVPARDPQAAPLAWKALQEEAGERLNAGRPFPTATGLPHALEAEWLRSWTAARAVYALDDLRKLGRALKARALWRLDSPITAGQLIKRLVDLLAEAVAWDGQPPAPRSGAPAPQDPGEAERRRLQGIADEEARRRRRAEMEAGAATPEEAARYAAEALAAAGGAS